MSVDFSKPGCWLAVLVSSVLISLGWVGYEAVGQELLINQLPLCS